MDKEELQAELDILFNPEPDEDGFFPHEYPPELSLSPALSALGDGRCSNLFRRCGGGDGDSAVRSPSLSTVSS